MLSFSEKMLKGKQHKLDKNKNGKLDAHDFKLLRKEESDIDEAVTVDTKKYSWGTMKTVHHGSSFNIPLHPEHHQAIAKLKDQQEHKFKTEDGKHWTARRKGDDVHLHSGNDGPKTTVKHADLKEELDEAKPGLYANINAKRKRIEAGSKERMRKPGSKGAPSAQDFKDAAKTANEEVEEIEELSKATLASYAKKASHDARIKMATGKDFERHAITSRKPEYKAGAKSWENKYKSDARRREAGVGKAIDRLAKEEVELDEAIINGREYASQGVMHPDHAKMDIHKVSNQHVDFYANKTGNKIQGKVVKNDGKSVHIQAHKELGDGKLHKFKVQRGLPKPTNEEVSLEESHFKLGDTVKCKTSGDTGKVVKMDKDHGEETDKYYTVKKENGKTMKFAPNELSLVKEAKDLPFTPDPVKKPVKNSDGTVQSPMSRARELAKRALERQMKKEQNKQNEETKQGDNMKSYKQFVGELVQTTDEAIDMNLLKSMQKSAASKPKPQSDSDGAIDPKTGRLLPYGYRGKSEYEKSETGDEPTKRGRKAGMKIGTYKRK